MSFDPMTAALDIGGKLIDRLWPDPTERAKAKQQLAQMQMDGDLRELEVRMSAIIAEAKSSDPWTSRARPSFLYVMYIMILAAIPMGVLSVFSPTTATTIAEGMKSWLTAVPDTLWGVFGVGYTGYTAARSIWDKKQIKNG